MKKLIAGLLGEMVKVEGKGSIFSWSQNDHCYLKTFTFNKILVIRDHRNLARNKLLQQVKLFILQPHSDFIKILIHPTYVFLDGFNCLLDTTELRTIFFQRAEESFYLVRKKKGRFLKINFITLSKYNPRLVKTEAKILAFVKILYIRQPQVSGYD